MQTNLLLLSVSIRIESSLPLALAPLLIVGHFSLRCHASWPRILEVLYKKMLKIFINFYATVSNLVQILTASAHRGRQVFEIVWVNVIYSFQGRCKVEQECKVTNPCRELHSMDHRMCNHILRFVAHPFSGLLLSLSKRQSRKLQGGRGIGWSWKCEVGRLRTLDICTAWAGTKWPKRR